MEDKDLYWLVGLLEGEGCFMKGTPSRPNSPKVVLQTTDKDICERVAKLFGVRCLVVKSRNPNWKQVYQTGLIGTKAVDMMNLLHPHMGERRRKQIEIAISSYKKSDSIRNNKLNWQIVNDIRNDINNGLNSSELKIKYDISIANLSKIKNNLIWKQ